MLCYRSNTSRRNPASPLIAVGAFVVWWGVSLLSRRWLQRTATESLAAKFQSRLTPRGSHRAMDVFQWAAAGCFIVSPAVAQDHIIRPVKKQWRVASSQHSPPTASGSTDGSKINNRAEVQLANHGVPDEDVPVHPSELPITNRIHHGHAFEGEACDCGHPDCCDATITLSDNDRGCGNWISVDYLHWTTTGGDLPPLIRSSPNGTLPQQTAVLGQTGTTLLGGNSEDFTESGIRIGGGWWFDD